MKINGPNHTNLNPYQKQLNKQTEIKKAFQQEDKLEISHQAKNLQENARPDAAREKKVAEIKQAVDQGEYKINAEKTAQKMIQFWNSRK
ncbi:negative regulator of flagellin synthesis FlgM [Thalassobacillus cyri]|uniref:Negative regulator of flagellin synthesis n=1 Tax=Thalassobacillus cyri TaxID=571932 RepID=A0A1H4AU86_9BACI|nr:flagellar biosynthesis anti-sigma factor FlgM [Thalassobacillus cyri]SEA39371.1 negative regulator of flagellin synthesis FlgM [Thalassobacillus cyri]